MAIFAGKTYEGEPIDLDNNTYRDCIFIDCNFRYSGIGIVGHLNATGCTWDLHGAALRTFDFIHANSIPFCDNCKGK